MNIQAILNQFNCEGELLSFKEFGSGHINRTFLASYSSGKRYVLQQVNTTVFKNANALMRNVFAVTDYLREKIAAAGGEAERETLHFIPTKSGETYFRTPNGDCYRLYIFVENSVSYDAAATPEQFAKSGAAFGKFQKMLADFSADSLAETIAHFHDTPWRYENEFLPAVKGASAELLAECDADIAFVKERAASMNRITDGLAAGTIPVRVTHNDTKLNNVLFDETTGKSLAVIDLDTVMPGSALYDFGDSIRYGAANAAEDERDLAKVTLDLAYFEAYAAAFLQEAGDSLRPTEIELLPYAAWLITLECGMRFLTDYLNGNIYFTKIDYPRHNLDRARNQFALVRDMETKMPAMQAIVQSLCADC